MISTWGGGVRMGRRRVSIFMFFVLVLDILYISKTSGNVTYLQTHHVDSTLKRRGNGRFHVVSTLNPSGVFVGYFHFSTFLNVVCLYSKTE